MHAYLFVGGAVKNREEKMQDHAKKMGKVFNFPIQKIADVRDLANFTKFSQAEKVSLVIRDIDKATHEALNAFLKVLEEPGKNITFFLSCNNEQYLLSTITSRCQVVRTTNTGILEGSEPSKILSSFMKTSFGGKIRTFEKLKKKEEVIEHLEKMIHSAHKNIINGKNTKKYSQFLKHAQNSINNLNLNANVNLQMTSFAINSGKCGFTKDG